MSAASSARGGEGCEAVQELEAALGPVGDAAAAEGFAARTISLEVRGLCRACAAGAGS
jgi:Fe2+ or Zn2+ uptake regulation protein